MSDKQDLIKSLDHNERDALAHMLMTSLRGNWRNPENRTEMLIEVAEQGLSWFNEERVLSRAESFKERIENHEHVDGRTFRSIYEARDLDISQVISESRARELATHMMHDETWGEFKFNKEYNND